VSLFPLQIVIEEAEAVMAGAGFTVNEKLLAALVHPFPFFTVIVPVYVAAPAFAGMEMLIGVAGKLASTTFAKPANEAEGLHVMLYEAGDPVTAPYVKELVCEFGLKHTVVAVDDEVIVGAAFTVTT
jgi:hypothetical protein